MSYAKHALSEKTGKTFFNSLVNNININIKRSRKGNAHCTILQLIYSYKNFTCFKFYIAWITVMSWQNHVAIYVKVLQSILAAEVRLSFRLIMQQHLIVCKNCTFWRNLMVLCCRTRLTNSLRLLTSHLSDVKTRAKRLNAIRQSRQNELYTIQQHIREHSERIVAQVRQRESALLSEVQGRFDSALNVDGCASLAELEFRKTEIEKLISDVRQLLAGPPLSCLLYFDEIALAVCRLTDASLHGSGAATSSRLARMPKPVRFVPSSLSDMDIIIGCLQDCGLSDADAMEAEEPQSPSTTSSPPRGNTDNQSSSSSGTRKRTASILSAVSPSRKCESRGCRMKSIARLHHQSVLRSDASDGAVAASSSVPDTSVPATAAASVSFNATANIETSGTSAASVSVTTTLSGSISQHRNARILFTIDQVLPILPPF